MKWGWLTDNLGLKLFALLLATLLYLHVLTERTVDEPVAFPLVLSGLADSLSFATAPPANVVARLHGTGKQILRLRYLKPPLEVSLAGVGPGTFQRTLAPADLPLANAAGVSVVEIVEPTRLALEVAVRGERRIPVQVGTSGTPARGFVVAGDPIVSPRSVRVSGPEPWLGGLESLTVQPVAVNGRRETLHVVQALSPLPAFARVVPGSVTVAVPIDAEEAKTVRVPIEVRGIRGELRAELQPEAVLVTWRGPRSQADAIEARVYRARVDAGRKGRGQWHLPVEVSGPGLGRAARRATARATPDSVHVVLH